MSLESVCKSWRLNLYLITSTVASSVIANLLIILALIQAPQFSFKENSLSDLGQAPLGNKTFNIFNVAVIIAALGSIPLCRFYSIRYLHFPTESFSAYIGTLSLNVAMFSLFLGGIFPISTKGIHFYGASLFLLCFSWTLVFYGIDDFKNERRNFAFLEILTLIIMWTVFLTFFLLRSQGNWGFAIPEIIMIIVLTLNGNSLWIKSLQLNKSPSH